MKYQFLPATFTHFTMAPEAVIGDTLHEAAFNLAVGIPALHRMAWVHRKSGDDVYKVVPQFVS